MQCQSVSDPATRSRGGTSAANTVMKAIKTPRRSRRAQAVRLETVQPGAQDVCVAGSFNDWKPQATPMVPLGNDRWSKEFTLPDGRYEYKFVVDGVWITDINARENVLNPFGSMNSVLTIATRP